MQVGMNEEGGFYSFAVSGLGFFYYLFGHVGGLPL